jgi:hypothetical protein
MVGLYVAPTLMERWQHNQHTYKNAIANELFLAAAITLHKLQPTGWLYFSWALREFEWFYRSGVVVF